MSSFRVVALLPLLGAASCYSDSPSQSTLPTTPFADEPRYTQGPPGGAMDADPRTDAYAPQNPGFAPSDDDDDEEPQANLAPAAPPQPGPAEGLVEPADPSDGAPGAPVYGPGIAGPVGGSPGDPALAGPADPQAAEPTAGVTDVEIDATLDGYGSWVDTEDYGPVWRPDATVVGVDFTPYETAGSWAYTDAGWAFASDYNWGWLPFHYGRWAWFEDSWGWVPGHRWSPAWVDWRCGNGVVGWRPRMPHAVRPNDPNRPHRHYGRGELIRDGRRAQSHDGHWRFAADRDFARPHIRSHLYGNTAEGLRLTSRVQTPPLRARTTLRANEVMRDRYSVRRYGAPTQQGYRQPSRVERPYQRPYQRPYAPGQSYARPERYSAPQRTWTDRTPPGRVWTSPNRPARAWGGPPSTNGSHTGGGPGRPPSGFSPRPITDGSHTGGGPGRPPSGFSPRPITNGSHTGGGPSGPPSGFSPRPITNGTRSSSGNSGSYNGGHSGGSSSGSHSGGSSSGSYSGGSHSGGHSAGRGR